MQHLLLAMTSFHNFVTQMFVVLVVDDDVGFATVTIPQRSCDQQCFCAMLETV